MATPPALPPIPNRDLLLRLSYTQQAATYLHLAQHAQAAAHQQQQQQHASGSGSSATSKGKQREVSKKGGDQSSNQKRPRKATRQKDGGPGSLDRLARSMMSDVPRVASHTKIRLDPNFKRSFCKECKSVLLPGLTAKVVTRPSQTHGHLVSTTCNHCSTTKVLPRPALYPLPLPTEALLAPKAPQAKKKKKKNMRLLPMAGQAATASALPAPPSVPLDVTSSRTRDTDEETSGVSPFRLADLGGELPPSSPSAHPCLPALPPPAADSPPPELRYNQRERRQLRLLARRSIISVEDRAAKETFKHGKRRPGGAEAGYGTGGGRDILSEREGVGHWRTEGKGWSAV